MNTNTTTHLIHQNIYTKNTSSTHIVSYHIVSYRMFILALVVERFALLAHHPS